MMISVVIPTHDRASLLKRHLDALGRQTYPRRDVEWIVVCDGCSDDSAAIARAAGADRVIEQQGRGAAAARNAGLGAATAPLVAFLDDDIIPDSGWLLALVHDADGAADRTLHMGYCPFAQSAIRTYLDRRNADWYEAKLRAILNPNHKWRFTDFFGGNFAAGRDALLGLGGFDERFALFEDAELALRALEAGWQIRYVPGARAEHHAHRNASDYARQAFRSGQADVLFSQVHPEAAASLRLGLRRPPGKRVAGAIWRGLASRRAFGIRAAEAGARLSERLSLHRVSDFFYALLWDGQYWRGVAAA